MPVTLRLALAALILHAPLSAQSEQDACAWPGVSASLAGSANYERVTALARGNIPANTFLQRASDLTVASCFLRRLAQFDSVMLSARPAISRATFNSAYPLDRNNGAMWAGRGLSTALNAGIAVTSGNFELALQPIFAYHQNQSFPVAQLDMPGFSPLINTGHPQVIDWPVRFGREAYALLDPGQSFVRWRRGRFTAGAATENIWIGAALRNPVLMSNTAAGFPHIYFNYNAQRTRLGAVNVDIFGGRLDESDYFDDVEGNDGRMISALALAYAPRWTPGLSLGLARLYTAQLAGHSAAELLGRTIGVSADELRSIEDNSLFALFGRYALPSVGLEVFAEWAHENGFTGLLDLLREPDQSQAYVLGFQKLTPVRDNFLRLYAEVAHLETAQPLRGGRGVVSFYTHGAIAQGHTQRGQILGAWIGPGSDAQIIGLEWLQPRWRSELYVERVRFDADAYFDQWAKYYGHNGQDAQLALGSRQVLRWRALEGTIDISYARRYNRNFYTLTGDQPGSFSRENNFQLDLQLVWLPGLTF